MYQSVKVADAAFDCDWHLTYCPSLRKGLTLMIQRAQRSKKITALGMADLNILSFIEIPKGVLEIMAITMRDVGKFPLVLAKVMLSNLCLWPLNRSLIFKVVRYIMLGNMLFMGSAHLIYMLKNITDMAVMASTCKTLSTIIQTFSKLFLINYYSEDLAHLLNIVANEYWPADLAGPETERSILIGSRVIVTMKKPSTGLIISIRMGIESVVRNTICLAIFLLQFHSCPHDTQFKLLKAALRSIGTGKDKIINRKLRNYPVLPDKNYQLGPNEEEEYELVAKCIDHHNKIIYIFGLELGQTTYMIQNFTDVTEMASTCTTVSTSFQALSKLLILYLNLNIIKDMLRVYWFQFWPVDIANDTLKSSLRFNTRLITLNMISIYSSGILFASEFLMLPIITGKRSLPFASCLPFDWKKSPVYEITYLYQVITNGVFVITSICGIDFLFISLMLNTVTQFKILKYVIMNVGTSNVKDLNEKLDAFIEEDEEDLVKHDDTDMTLMRKCIKHHIKLLKFCEDLEIVFSGTVFVQYVSSISAICMSSFIISLSSDLATAAFQSNWYLSDNMQLRRNLIMVIQRAQKAMKITALGFTDLNFESFVKIVSVADAIYEVDWWKSDIRAIRQAFVLIIQRSNNVSTLKAGGMVDLDMQSYVKVK
ncbi:Odorant receptor 85d [Carabus blaptoides fortunei]